MRFRASVHLALRRPEVQLGLGLLVLFLLAMPELAEGRVGGGEGFSSGRSSRSSSGSSGGGGGDIGPFIDLILWLLVVHPEIGVPLLIGGLILFGVKSWLDSRRPLPQPWVTDGHAAGPQPRKQRRKPDLLHDLRTNDPGFSEAVLIDFLILVHHRALVAAARKAWDPLRPFVAPELGSALEGAVGGASEVTDVVVGSVQVRELRRLKDGHQLVVRFLANRTLVEQGRRTRWVVEEDWTFFRALGAVGLPPDRVERMGCPSCGSAVDTDDLGACRSCGTAITKGQLQWQGRQMRVVRRDPLPAPKVGPNAGGDEPGVYAPSSMQHDLPARLRALQGRHPDFRASDLEARVHLVFHALQEGWGRNDEGSVRPYVTDTLFQTLRFWLDRYRAAGLNNRLTTPVIEKVQITHVQLDAWYESVTLRLWAHGFDATYDAKGKVVGGNAEVSRRFSEYWTFLRSAGGSAKAGTQAACPSCGAPLDKVNQAGVCGYCDTRITNGAFDWVLSRIDQAEALAD